jgi:CRISPR/Cas system type I-B associated protein Csh2 (Cas7 group RAMP superfamily)
MTADALRQLVRDELNHHALAGGVLDGLVRRAVRNYLADAVTPAHLEPGIAAVRDWLRAALHRADDELAATDTQEFAAALNDLLWDVLAPVVGRNAAQSAARGHPPPGDPDA